jgi:uncharacterized membrane protein (UPF0127 family)
MGSSVAPERLGFVTALVLGLALAGPAAAACSAGAVDLRRPDGQQARFSVELADTAEERARGLMFRDSMPSSSGMLFLYPAPQPASFWMKNTLIPLDMIFAERTGVVTHVHPMAVPGDLTAIDGGPDVLAVLEINGGLAARLGIVPGSVLRHPALDQSSAAWPCAE